jgi:hypothetical protein
LINGIAIFRRKLANCPAISVKRVHEELTALGFCGGYTIVRERVRRIAYSANPLDEERLKLWLFEILMSKRMDPATREEIGNIGNLDLILDRTKNGSIPECKRALTSPDPEYREKVELLLESLQSLGNDEMLFFVDELGPL